jgi:hypothetical protein
MSKWQHGGMIPAAARGSIINMGPQLTSADGTFCCRIAGHTPSGLQSGRFQLM